MMHNTPIYNCIARLFLALFLTMALYPRTSHAQEVSKLSDQFTGLRSQLDWWSKPRGYPGWADARKKGMSGFFVTLDGYVRVLEHDENFYSLLSFPAKTRSWATHNAIHDAVNEMRMILMTNGFGVSDVISEDIFEGAKIREIRKHLDEVVKIVRSLESNLKK